MSNVLQALFQAGAHHRTGALVNQDAKDGLDLDSFVLFGKIIKLTEMDFDTLRRVSLRWCFSWVWATAIIGSLTPDLG